MSRYLEQSWTQSVVNELWHMICTVWRKILSLLLCLTLRAIWYTQKTLLSCLFRFKKALLQKCHLPLRITLPLYVTHRHGLLRKVKDSLDHSFQIWNESPQAAIVQYKLTSLQKSFVLWNNMRNSSRRERRCLSRRHVS